MRAAQFIEDFAGWAVVVESGGYEGMDEGLRSGRGQGGLEAGNGPEVEEGIFCDLADVR